MSIAEICALSREHRLKHIKKVANCKRQLAGICDLYHFKLDDISYSYNYSVLGHDEEIHCDDTGRRIWARYS